MSISRWIWTILVCLAVSAGWIFWDMLGSGAFRRAITITGVYSICRPDHYEVVCFLDADSKHGGMFCMPLSAVGGECHK